MPSEDDYNHIKKKIRNKTIKLMKKNIEHPTTNKAELEELLYGINDELPENAKFSQEVMSTLEKNMLPIYKEQKKHFKDRTIFGVGKTAPQKAKTLAAMATRFIGGFFSAAGILVGEGISAVGYAARTICPNEPNTEYKRNLIQKLGNVISSKSWSLAVHIANKQIPITKMLAVMDEEYKDTRDDGKYLRDILYNNSKSSSRNQSRL